MNYLLIFDGEEKRVFLEKNFSSGIALGPNIELKEVPHDLLYLPDSLIKEGLQGRENQPRAILPIGEGGP